MNKENLVNNLRELGKRFTPVVNRPTTIDRQEVSVERTEVLFAKDRVVQTYDEHGNPTSSHQTDDAGNPSIGNILLGEK